MEGCSRASVKYVLYQSISSPPNHHKENEECPCFTRSVFLTIEVNKLYYLITSSEGLWAARLSASVSHQVILSRGQRPHA